jgi:hypothetical protein
MDLVKRYCETPNPTAENKKNNRFTSADGHCLQQLQQELLPLKETALGLAAKQNAKAVAAHLDKLDYSDKEELLQALQLDQQSHPRGQPKDDDNYGIL